MIKSIFSQEFSSLIALTYLSLPLKMYRYLMFAIGDMFHVRTSFIVYDFPKAGEGESTFHMLS